LTDTPLAVRPDEAARMLSVGRTFFRKSVLPELRTIEVGSLRLIPVAELARWVAQRSGSNSFGGGPTAGGPSASDSTDVAASLPPESSYAARKRRLFELAESSTRKPSGEKTNVVPLRGRKNRSRRSRANG